MTVFEDKKIEDQGTWFPYFSSRFDGVSKEYVYDEPLPGAARFRIRETVSFFVERQKKRKKRSEFVLNPQSRAMERVTYPEDQTPDEVERELCDLRDYVVTGIEGAQWSDGSQIECTRENKLRLFKNEQFDRFVGKCITMLSGQAETSEKN